jgi:hypothetical protein
MGWAAFWSIFSRTHLVTLIACFTTKSVPSKKHLCNWAMVMIFAQEQPAMTKVEKLKNELKHFKAVLSCVG